MSNVIAAETAPHMGIENWYQRALNKLSEVDKQCKDWPALIMRLRKFELNLSRLTLNDHLKSLQKWYCIVCPFHFEKNRSSCAPSTSPPSVYRRVEAGCSRMASKKGFYNKVK
jgi:hypothetical protein